MASMLRRISSNCHISSCHHTSRISLALLNKRNFKTSGFGSEYTKEQRTEMDWKYQQRSRPMDFNNPLTYVGLVTPMITVVYCFYMINKLWKEKTEEEEQKEKEAIRQITHRDSKLKDLTMAEEKAEEELIAEQYKTSLLDTLRDSYEENRELRCTRVLYIGQLASTKQKEMIENMHTEFMKSQQSEQDITGALLFINNNSFYHMLEVESLDSLRPLFTKMIIDTSTDFFQSIDESHEDKNKTNQELEGLEVRICSISEEITREFPIWSVRNVKLPGGSNDDKDKKGSSDATTEETDEVEEDEESLQGVMFETMKAMIEIGRQLCMKEDKEAAIKLFQSSQREIMNRFPTPDKISFFMESKLLFDMQQFVDYFFSPIDVKLESEYTWPVEPMIQF